MTSIKDLLTYFIITTYLHQNINKISAVAEILATTDKGRKVGAAAPLSVGGDWASI